MKKNFIVFRIVSSSILLIICLIILFSFMFGKLNMSDILYGKNGDYTSVNEQTVSIDTISNINMNGFGSDSIYVYPTDSTDVKLIQSSTATLEDEDLISILKGEDTLNISRGRRQTKFWFFGINVRRQKIELFIPKNYANNLSTSISSGKLVLGDLTLNKLDVSLSSGLCELENLNAKDLSLKLSSGTLSGVNIFSDNINTDISSGKLNVKGEFKNIDTQTSSGSTYVSSNTLPDSLKSHVSSGKTEISIPENDGFALNYKKSSGSINSDFSLTNFDKNNKSGSANYKNGGNTYTFSVSSGKINLKKF